jgi:hypothetical protein
MLAKMTLISGVAVTATVDCRIEGFDDKLEHLPHNHS